MKVPIFLKAVLLLLLPLNAVATEAVVTEEEDSLYFSSTLNTTHDYISEGLLYLPRTIDNFFADERSELESNKSTFRLSLDTLFQEGGVVDFKQTFRAKLIMPHSKERLRFTVESTPEETQSTQQEQENSAIENPTGDNQQSAVLEAILKETEAWRLSTDVGVKLHTPIDPFIRVRGRKEWQFSSLQVRFTQTLFEFKSTGAGARSILDIEHPLAKQRLLRFSTTGTWWDELQAYLWSQNISLYRKLDLRRGLAYTLGINGSDYHGNEVDSYILDIRYRKRIHREWLFYELSPRVSFDRENNFKDNWGFLLRVEVIFGKEGLISKG